MDLRRIDEVSLNSWPALQQLLFDGWILRFSKGYTKRANSVSPLYEGRIPVDEKVRYCEEAYEYREMSPIFRILPFAQGTELDRYLEGLGYRIIDTTSMQYLDLRTFSLDPDENVGISIGEEDQWLHAFQKMAGLSERENRLHKELIRAIPSTKCLMLIREKEQIVSCGLGVVEKEFVGLFDFITLDEERNQGLGERIVTGMLSWGKQQGARHAYLQMVIGNMPAKSLYAKFNFKHMYEYWYRVK